MSRNARRRKGHGAGALRGLVRLAGRIAIPSAGLGFALWGSAVMADLLLRNSGAPEVASLSFVRPAPAAVSPFPAAVNVSSPQTVAPKRARVAPPAPAEGEASGAADKQERLASLELPVLAPRPPSPAARFDQIAKDTDLSSERLAELFGPKVAKAEPAKARPRKEGAGPARSGGAAAPVATATVDAEAIAALAPPSAARFGTHSHEAAHLGTLLAYADHAPSRASAALAALSDVAPLRDGTLEPYLGALPDGTDFEDTPEAAPSPVLRSAPSRDDDQDQRRGKARILEDGDDDGRGKPAAKPRKAGDEERVRPDRQDTRAERKLAFAKPDDPREKPRGGLFNNLFGGRPSAGRGVAVYDICAAKVYMPDGSVLEAHSGIGHMADNPKYAHVKMKGPTPPHTYNLRMREKRFHGVEAIRMLPVDGKNKHGRDGFLTHSYLLRGGRAESHGCVAFKDYDKFLNAFKKGKVKQLVVVPGGGKAVMTAKNGRGA